MKKIVLIILILMLAATSNVYATSFPDISQNSYLEESVGVLSSYGIMQGYPDGTFKPDKIVTRAEMAKIVTVAAGFYEYSQNMTSVYSDMKGHWAESYVELANVLNIVKGTTESTYAPDKFIKFAEAYTMIIRLLGYSDESLPGEWPPNYFEKAKELNLFVNVDTSVEFATRKDISMMLYNALSCDLVKVKENNTVYSTNKTLLSIFGKKETKEVTSSDLKIEDFDFTDYMFNKWDFYYANQGNIVYAANPRYNEFSGTVTSLLKNRVIFVTDDYGNVKAFQLSDIPIVINGKKDSIDNLENSRIKVVYEDNSFNGDVVGIIAYKRTDVMVLEKNDLYKSGSKIFAGKYLPTNSKFEINLNKLHIYGAASSLEEIKTNDVIYFYETEESNKITALTLYVFRKQVSGVVTYIENINNITYYTVNNINYKTGENFIYVEPTSVNDNVELILDKDKNIIKINILDYGKLPSTFGIVISSLGNTSASPTAKILDELGKYNTYSLADNSSVVNVIESDSNLFKQTSLRANDLVKFDSVTNGPVKIINTLQSKYIASNYNAKTLTLSNGNWLSADTFIVYATDGKYQLLELSQLGTYLEGKAVVNSYGHIDAIYLNKGIKEPIFVAITPEVLPSYNGTVYGIVKSVTKVDNSTSNVLFFNNSNVFTISNASSAGMKISSVLNYYSRAVIVNGTITNIDKVTPETEKIKITQIYSNQMLIDSITYMEYSSNVLVYNCTTDDLGNITSFKLGSKYDIKSGTTAQLYDLYGGFDGIIDVILVFN